MLCCDGKEFEQTAMDINLPIATPIMWTLLAVGVAMGRDAVSEEKAVQIL